MNREIATQWVQALRSGDYVQTCGALRDANGFCCLGVLCDLASKDGVGQWMADPSENTVDSKIIYFGRNAKDAHYEVLPRCVRDWAESKTHSVIFSTPAEHDDYYQTTYSINQMNDSGTSFAELADLIEKHFELI